MRSQVFLLVSESSPTLYTQAFPPVLSLPYILTPPTKRPPSVLTKTVVLMFPAKDTPETLPLPKLHTPTLTSHPFPSFVQRAHPIRHRRHTWRLAKRIRVHIWVRPAYTRSSIEARTCHPGHGYRLAAFSCWNFLRREAISIWVSLTILPFAQRAWCGPECWWRCGVGCGRWVRWWIRRWQRG